MGKKAFLPASGPARSPLAALPARVLAAAGFPAPGRSARPDAGADALVLRAPVREGIVLGVDPGTLLVGYGAIHVTAMGLRLSEAGVVRTDRRSAPPVRLGVIQREITRLLEKIRPTVVVVERAFAARNVQSALRIGEGRGVILACAASFGADVVEIPPASAKKAVVGNGAADKVQVARMAAVALGLRDLALPLDASDALALALAHVWNRFGRHGRSSRER